MPSIIADMKLPPPTGQLGTTGIHSSSSKVANSVAADNIGSFRADRDWEDALPSNLRNLLGKNLLHITTFFVERILGQFIDLAMWDLMGMKQFTH